MTETFEYWDAVYTSECTKQSGIYFHGLHVVDMGNSFLGKYGGIYSSDSYAFFIKKGVSEMIKHRLDGPSVIWGDGTKYWYINSIKVAQFGFNEPGTGKRTWKGPLFDWAIENNIDLDNLTDDDKMLIKMVWA